MITLPVICPHALPLALLHGAHAGVDRVDRLEDAAAHLPELADGGRGVGDGASAVNGVVAPAVAVGLEVVLVGVGSRLKGGDSL